jgi:hypothetical protein
MQFFVIALRKFKNLYKIKHVKGHCWVHSEILYMNFGDISKITIILTGAVSKIL